MVTGSWIKVLSASPDRFYLAFIGQVLVGTAQIFILGVPARLAAVWFPSRQVSTACSLGVFGNQVGVALGFLLPPLVVQNVESLDEVGKQLMVLYYILAAVPTAAFLLVVFFFQKEPPTPCVPTDKSEETQTYIQSVKALLTNRNFLYLLVSYGINVGIYYVVSTLLNQMVLLHFQGAEQDAGRIGLCMVLAGVVGSVTAGVILDKTHKFKECTVMVYLMGLACTVGFAFTFSSGYIWLIYLAGGCLGFFMIGYLPVGYEFGAELTYPVPEGTSSGILNFSGEVVGILATLAAGELFRLYGDMVANLVLVGLLFSGFILSLMINGKDLRRQAAVKG